jgi:ribosomal protein S18 acetylase RimI-like enzyme
VSLYRIEPLAAHDRAGFSCGDENLDRYFRELIGQDVRRGAATAFVAIDRASGETAGFYTLSAAHVDRDELPLAKIQRAPRYARIPAVLIGRLAVAIPHQGCKLGGALVADAFRRTIASGIGVRLLVVEPKNEQARSFYTRWGFEPLQSRSGIMYVPVETLGAALL